jgi:methanethiol S-methyltransferase
MTTTTVSADTRNRSAALASASYAAVAYLAFLGVVVYAMFFLADVVVPRTVDSGGHVSSTPVAVVVDVLLLGAFAVQHSVMARSGFKNRLTRVVPAHLERSTYVLASSAVLALLWWQWRPIPGVVWHVGPASARALIWGLYGAGWAWAFAMTFAIDHFDLFGLRQVARHLRGSDSAAPAFSLPWAYQLVRHPMMTGFIVAFLAAPTMTGGHLLFAVLACGYILIGVRLEERDLEASLPQYAGYAAATPRFVPRRLARRVP